MDGTKSYDIGSDSMAWLYYAYLIASASSIKFAIDYEDIYAQKEGPSHRYLSGKTGDSNRQDYQNAKNQLICSSRLKIDRENKIDIITSTQKYPV
jgi:hypothetical protein